MAQAMDEIALELGQQVEEAAAYHQVSAEYRTTHGDPARELAQIADDVKADAVVVGASTRAGHMLVGSVAVRLVRAGRWPVTVVP
jgi:nucleotide-binding universal stress UspA family protein